MAVYKPAQRKKLATVKTNGDAKYPIGDKAHAQAAKARINQAKPPLIPAQRAAVAKKAAKYGVKIPAKKKG